MVPQEIRPRLATSSLGVLALLLLGMGCSHTARTQLGPAPPASFDDGDDGTRETLLIVPAEGTAATFDFGPAPIDTVLIRSDMKASRDAVIEVLVKGSFQDGCSELHELAQQPSASGQAVSLVMRRPSDAICTQVVRPYRFFFVLDRRFAPGSYVLSINSTEYPFSVRMP